MAVAASAPRELGVTPVMRTVLPLISRAKCFEASMAVVFSFSLVDMVEQRV